MKLVARVERLGAVIPRRALRELIRAEFPNWTPELVEETAEYEWPLLMRIAPRDPVGLLRRVITGVKAMSREELLELMGTDEELARMGYERVPRDERPEP